MRDYHVHFSFYSEEFGTFDNMYYSVRAETPFEAREKAWAVCDEDKDTLFRSNIRQFAVTWNSSLLDAGDYFYSYAADIKQDIGRIVNVEILNDTIANGGQEKRWEGERGSNLAVLYTIDTMAKDLYADKGILPPSIYEELYYTERLCEHLGWGEKADALWERMEKAKKWDRGAIYSIRDMFRNGYTTMCGETEHFSEQFGRNGMYPVRNKLDEWDYSYIYRWQNRKVIDRLMRIPLLKETDVIKNSGSHMDYSYQTLLIDSKNLNPEYQLPENQLWQPVDSYEQDKDREEHMLFVENPITGQRMHCDKENFFGVVRPDIETNFDYNTMKEEYVLLHCADAVNNRDTEGHDVGIEDGENEFER